MKLNTFMIVGTILATATLTSGAFAASPESFFLEALATKAGVVATNMQLSAAPDVQEKRAEQTATALFHQATNNGNRDQREIWTMKFTVDRNGRPEAESCNGTLVRAANMTDQTRLVTIDKCQLDFRPDMSNGVAVNNQLIELQ